MITSIVDDPRNWNYPFPNVFYDDGHVVYHGTSTPYSQVLESQGFTRGQLPFEVSELRRLQTICDEIGHQSWARQTVSGLSSSTQLARAEPRKIYFSANFWFARSYATNAGGETVHNALLLCDELLGRLADGNEENRELMRSVQLISGRLRTLINEGKPIVYAVKVDDEWLDQPLEREDLGDWIELPVNVSCNTSVPAERILAKAIYVNGAEDGYVGPQPAQWKDAIMFCRPSPD